MARLKEQYKAEVAPALYKKFGYKSTMQIPKIDKVVVNVGCGEAKENAKVLEAVVRDLTTITGQKAVVTKANSFFSGFEHCLTVGVSGRTFLYPFEKLPDVLDLQTGALQTFDHTDGIQFCLTEPPDSGLLLQIREKSLFIIIS